MARQTKAFAVGLFMIGGTVLAITVLIWLGASHWFQETYKYVTYFDTSVQGLNLDASVKFRGVQVGRVNAIGVAPDGYLIEVVIELQQSSIVSDSLRAKVELAGVTGLKFIALDIVGPEKALMHPDLKFKAPFPVIPSYPGGFEEIEQALRDIYDKIIAIDTEGISYQAKSFLNAATSLTLNADSLIMDQNITGWAKSFDQTINRADSMLSHLDFALYDEQLEKSLREFEQGVVNLNIMLSSFGEQVTAMSLKTRLDTVFMNLNSTVTVSADVMNGFQYQAAQVMNNVNNTITEMNEAITQLNSLIMTVENYPSNILYSAPPPKEK